MDLPRLRLGWVAAAVGLLTGAVGGWLPLMGGPGYESALLAGLVLPSVVALGVAWDVVRARSEPLAAVSLGLARGSGLALVALAITFLHGWRAGWCDPAGDTLWWLLTAGVGTIVGGVWGAGAGLVADRLHWRPRMLAVLLSVLGPVGGVALSVWRFYTTPMVFAFDPFFGVFSGPLYDTVVDRLDQLLTYRLGSLLSVLTVCLFCAALERDSERSIRWRRSTPRLVWMAGALFALGSFLLTLAAPDLGHVTTRASLEQALGAEATYGVCRVVHARSIPAREARLLARECDAHVRQLATYLDTSGPPACTVYLFADAAEKGRLMGASHTHIAKPWRREVYVQQAGYPHPVLRHELAHVVAGAFAPGPFRVAGPLHGLVPDPGRIEGLATAAAPADDADLSLQQWARTLLDLELLPPLERVFRLSFLGQNSSTAYVVAGSFMDWLHATRGPRVVRGWYAGQDLAQLCGGQTLADLEHEWHQSLAHVEVSQAARDAARVRFDRPAIFGRTCPRVVDRLHRDAQRRLLEGDTEAARAAYASVLDLESHDVDARLGLARCAARTGDAKTAAAVYGEIADDTSLPVLERLEANERLADLALIGGHVAAARGGYARVARAVLDADHLRELTLKGSVGEEPGRAATLALLVGDRGQGRDWGVAASLLGRWAAADPDDGTASYLLGRNLFNLGRWEDAERQLREATARPLVREHFRAEAWRMQMLVQCALEHVPAAQVAYDRYREATEPSPARRAGTARVARRCGLQVESLP